MPYDVQLIGLCATKKQINRRKRDVDDLSISKAIVSLLPSPCRATALSAARRVDTIDLEMKLDNS